VPAVSVMFPEGFAVAAFAAVTPPTRTSAPSSDSTSNVYVPSAGQISVPSHT